MGRTKWDWARFDHNMPLSWVFDHSSRGSCHLKRGGSRKQRWRKFLAMESVNKLIANISGDLSVKGETGSVKGETKSANFLARESVSSSPIVRNFGKGKCKFIANFSATMVTSLPSISLSLYLSLSLSLSLTESTSRTIYRKRFRASYNKA